VTTPDLEPTQRLPTLGGDHHPYTESEGCTPAPPLRRGGFGILGLLARVLLVVLIGAIGVVALALLVTPPRESMLILGSDARPDELKRGEVGRTDTLLLFVGDRAMPRAAMLSVPRDLWVAIPGYGQERVNAAYELGGGQTAKQTMSNLLGQPVDRYLVIGLQGVRDVVDAVGGVDITVPQAIHDDAYPTDDYGYQTVDIPAGRQHMDGDTALKYARTRHQDSDFARTARQQQVVAAVRNAMLSPANLPRIPAVLAAISQSIKTDATPLDGIALGAALLRDAGDPDHLVIDTSLASEVTGADGAYLLQPKASLKPTVAQFLLSPAAGTGGSSNRPAAGAGASAPASVSIEVLNGAGVPGLAARTADRLKQAGFTVANVADAPSSQAQTTVTARPAARSTADRIAAAVGLPASRVSTDPNLANADIQVVLGQDASRL
jgi:polyisoprenyl-teichoic acid--peptidoglycan teichoic acid transferase